MITSRSRENLFKKFEWRISKVSVIRKNSEFVNSYWVVERRSKILGIAFWWTSSWEKYSWDGVNTNSMRWETKEEAEEQMEREKIERSRGWQTYTIVEPS